MSYWDSTHHVPMEKSVHNLVPTTQNAGEMKRRKAHED